jgi:LmbE family N-acetylglucosaminyl deacetylase
MTRTGAKGHELGAALRRILCISAHPDDNEFTIGGSVARWAREGRHVAFCLVTTGGAGVNDHTPSSDGLIPIRERETHAAARILGVKEVVLLGYADGTLEPTLAMRRDLTRVIRRVRPDVVVCGDPTVRFYGNEYMNHPDHRAAASAALDAVFPSSETSAIFPELIGEGLAPHKVKQVLIAGALDPDVFVDIAATLGAKCRALKAHRSQVGKGEWVEQLLTAWALRDGKRAGGGLRHAEAFKRMVLG